MQRFSTTRAAVLLGSIFIGGHGVAHAQAAATDAGQTADDSGDQLQEIVVTAERRKVDLQKLASSVSVRQGDAMLDAGRNNLTQVLEDVAGVAPVSAAMPVGQDNQGANIVIRGAIPNAVPAGTTVSEVPSTAVYTDDVYEGIGNTYDLDRVEILRGPQGTLYGRSATGGVVASHTRNPELNSFGGYVSAQYGNYATRDIQGALNLPVSDTFALRLSGDNYARDGYYTTPNGTGQTDNVGGRIKALYKPSEDFSLLLGAAIQTTHNYSGGNSFQQDTPSSFTYIPVEPVSIAGGFNYWQQYWAKLDWNVGIGTLTYIPALRKWYQDATMVIAPGPLGPGTWVNQPAYTPDEYFMTHELRLASNPGSRISWQTGVFYYDNSLTSSTSVDAVAPPVTINIFTADESKRTQNLGIFFEGTIPLTDTLRVTEGVRYDYTRLITQETYSTPNGSATIGGDDGRRIFHNTTYKVRLEKDLAPQNLVYLSASSAFLPGDVNITTGANQIPIANTYDAETLTAFELGTKNRFLGGSLQINGDIFFYNYGGYQTLVSVSGNQAAGDFTYFNEKVHQWGGEFEGTWQFTTADRASVNVSNTRGEYVHPDALFKLAAAQSELPGIPPWQVTLGYDHLFRITGGSTLGAHVDGRWMAGYHDGTVRAEFYDPSEGLEPYAWTSSQWVENANLTWASPGGMYSVSGYVRNLSDNRYKTSFNLQAGAVETRTAGLYDPRTYGISAQVRF